MRIESNVLKTLPVVERKHERIGTITELINFLKIRGPLYFNALSVISGVGNSFGWQRISKWEDGATKKIGAEPRSNKAIFTGGTICNFASFALYDGLKSKLENIDLDVVQIYTDFRAEDWGESYQQIQEWDHVIVKATARDTGEVLYLDPTYRQIDHRVEETVLTVPGDRLNNFYKDRQNRQSVSVLNRKDEILGELKTWGLSEEQYKKLVDILK